MSFMYVLLILRAHSPACQQCLAFKLTSVESYHDGMLQFATAGTEAVENLVLPEAVEPLPSWRGGAGNEVPALSFARTKAADNLRGVERVGLGGTTCT